VDGRGAPRARAAFDALAEGHALGAVLLQFPWSFRRNEANELWLRDLSRALQPLPLVVEVRHASWDDASEWLAEHGLGIANIDQPLLFEHSRRPSARATAEVAYVRLHGRNYQTWGKGARKPASAKRTVKKPKPIRGHGRRALRLPLHARRAAPWADAVQSLGAHAAGARGLRRHQQPPARPGDGQRARARGDDRGALVDCPPSLLEAYPRRSEKVARPAPVSLATPRSPTRCRAPVARCGSSDGSPSPSMSASTAASARRRAAARAAALRRGAPR
jgi:hypothetical protein